MKQFKATPRNFEQVIQRLMIHVRNDKHNAKPFCAALNNMLDELLNNDFFGTEGQCDPRGDRRD